MRIVLAVLLLAGAWAPVASAKPETCPGICDRIPAAAWISPAAVPLDGVQHWPEPARIAVQTTGQQPARFGFEEFCPADRADGPRAAAVSARADHTPPGQWQLHARILHWRGDTWLAGQRADEVFAAATAALRNCQQAAPERSPSLTVTEPTRLAAVVAGPVLLHTYLVAHPQSGSLSELTLAAPVPPPQPWPVLDDTAVLDAMTAALCAAYLGSCG